MWRLPCVRRAGASCLNGAACKVLPEGSLDMALVAVRQRVGPPLAPEGRNEILLGPPGVRRHYLARVLTTQEYGRRQRSRSTQYSARYSPTSDTALSVKADAWRMYVLSTVEPAA